MTHNTQIYDVIIAGAGPAGSSGAIHLANNGFRVLLIEQKQFPRAKLCGEFISPECLNHFQKLGVSEAMLASNPARIRQTVFYSKSGRSVSVPSDWFGGELALGLSRSAMDNNLLQKARSVGVEVLEAGVKDVLLDGRSCRGVLAKTDAGDIELEAKLTIDATGRARSLVRRLHQQANNAHTRPKFIAFKTHLVDANLPGDVCEIYSYSGGYGGLSGVENGISNLCFIVTAKQVRRCNSDADALLKESILKNQRARQTLTPAVRCSEWLTVALDRFGRAEPAPINGLIAIGDSAAFIDPFTGSGMLMALESGELAASVTSRHLKTSSGESLDVLRHEYRNRYKQLFGKRLKISGLLRLTAFDHRLAEITIALCNLNKGLRNRLARATRPNVVSGCKT